MDAPTQSKQIIAALSVGLMVLAPLDAGAGWGGGPPHDTAVPIVVYNPIQLTIDKHNNQHPVPVSTGPLFNASSVTDYVISAKTTLVNRDWVSHHGVCQLYAKISGKAVIIDQADIDVPGGNKEQNIALQGALCPNTTNVPEDVGVTCTIDNANTGAGGAVRESVLTLLPFSTDISPIQDRSLGARSSLSLCSPWKNAFQ